jgi:hypothetical protein
MKNKLKIDIKVHKYRTPYFTQLEGAEISNLSCKSVPGKIVSV